MYESLLTATGGLPAEFDRLQRELQQAMGLVARPGSIRAVAQGAFPAVNVGTTAASVEVYAFAPGLKAEDFNVQVERGVLVIEGERKTDRPASDAKQPVYAAERFAGRFRRSVSLPDDADPERVTARYRDGVLRVSIERRQPVQPRRIDVQ